MSSEYLLRCANRECETRRRNQLATEWPEHCGQRMVFATTFDEERFAKEKPSRARAPAIMSEPYKR